MKYVVCYSGGHSSALAAIETVRKHGRKNVILLNHDIDKRVEDTDVKRFKEEVASYLGLPITYANQNRFRESTPLFICREKRMFCFKSGSHICTYYLKTEPFYGWLKKNYPVRRGETVSDEITLVYGFDADEPKRMERRTRHLLTMGYRTEYPLLNSSMQETEEVGIEKPCTYGYCKHANCRGCIKAGRQHWYMVFCFWPDIFKEAVETEILIGHSILKGMYLTELVPQFLRMQDSGIAPGDEEESGRFWGRVHRILC